MKYIKIIFIAIVPFIINSCGDTAIFTEMSTNRLKVVIKGTLETNDVSHFDRMQSQAINSAPLQDDSVSEVTAGAQDTYPTTFMFDIAELALNGVKFGNYRQLIDCSLAGGNTVASESEPFFNGTGLVLTNDDPGEGNYDTVQIYIRKMIFNNAIIYGGDFVYQEPATVIFAETDRYGFDFNQLQTNSHWDNLRYEASEIFRNFPLNVPIIGGLQYNMDNAETVLEIRLVIKNFIKKYEYDYYDEGVFQICHYYAFSDWLRDVRTGENDIGRNIHAVARAYISGLTGSIDVTSATDGNYVIAIPSGENISNYAMEFPGSTVRNSNICDYPAGIPYPGLYIESILDYYLKYEKYKDDFNAVTCPDFDTYETEWDNYESKVQNFRIPPYVAFVAGGVASFVNIAPGTYKFYEVSMPSYGNLFLQSDFVSGWPPTEITGSDVTISIGVNPSI